MLLWLLRSILWLVNLAEWTKYGSIDTPQMTLVVHQIFLKYLYAKPWIGMQGEVEIPFSSPSFVQIKFHSLIFVKIFLQLHFFVHTFLGLKSNLFSLKKRSKSSFVIYHFRPLCTWVEPKKPYHQKKPHHSLCAS